MKNFIVEYCKKYNGTYKDEWGVRKFKSQIDVVRFICSHNINVYSVSWVHPLYKGQYIPLFEHTLTTLIINDNICIPKTFKKLLTNNKITNNIEG